MFNSKLVQNDFLYRYGGVLIENDIHVVQPVWTYVAYFFFILCGRFF